MRGTIRSGSSSGGVQPQAVALRRSHGRIYMLMGTVLIVAFVLFELATHHSSLSLSEQPQTTGGAAPRPSSSSNTTTRGFSPDLRVLFNTKGFVPCGGGSLSASLASSSQVLKKIPWSRVNDDYCDCPEHGLDEPGTSACANGQFWCEGEKHFLPTSLVDDGICDCCDGSDESTLNNIHQCVNTCSNYMFLKAEAPNSILKPKEEKSGVSLLMIFVWIFILGHLFAILGGLWYLATLPERDHIL